MASIQPIKNKDGQITSYRIRVYRGKDAGGNDLKPYSLNWKIPKTYKSERAIQKALEKVAGEFEASCRRGEISTDSRTLEEYASYYIEANKADFKAATVAFYKSMLPLLHDGIGNMKLKQLSPEHLKQFYNKLQYEDVKRDHKATAKDKLFEVRKESKVLQKAIHEATGLCNNTLHNAFHGENISVESARRLSEYFGYPVDDLFTVATSGKGLSPTYIRHVHNFIHTVLNEAVSNGTIPQNVADRVKPPKTKKHEAEFFELDEILTIKAALDDEPFKYRLAAYLLIDTGIRRGELVGLRWKSIDLKNHTIRIENNVVYTAETGIIANSAKNDDCRTLNIAPELIPVLQEYRKYQKRQARILFSGIEDDFKRAKAVKEYNPNGYLFTQESGQVMTPNAINQWAVSFSKKLGMRIYPHKFRHSQASLLYASGGTDIVTISKRLGHKQVSTTQNIYAHLLEKSDKQASDVISDLIFKHA